jgi:iron complex outermembrane receptor protein
LNIALHADNLLNKKYYDHTSYYRLIDVPEPGRNVSLMVGLEF